jgi:hypothetical protein
MKTLMISFLAVLSLSAHAAKYNCKLSNGNAMDPDAVTYQFDTTKEDNKFVDMGEGSTVGCVVLRTQPQILGCGLGNGENFSLFVTADDGSSLVSVQAGSQGNKTVLSCIKQP